MRMFKEQFTPVVLVAATNLEHDHLLAMLNDYCIKRGITIEMHQWRRRCYDYFGKYNSAAHQYPQLGPVFYSAAEAYRFALEEIERRQKATTGKEESKDE